MQLNLYSCVYLSPNSFGSLEVKRERSIRLINLPGGSRAVYLSGGLKLVLVFDNKLIR